MPDPGQRVLLGHGGGGLLTRDLVADLFLRHLSNPALDSLEDAARLAPASGQLALTTDAFVVDPLFFPGGDVGGLAVCGTVNDLLVSGARPLGLSAAFILEEGLPLTDLERIVRSMAAAAAAADVPVVTGDTKVVPRGKGDGCYITTAGVGVVVQGARLSASNLRPGDQVLVSGSMGHHGAAIMACRAGLDLGEALASDCAPLTALLAPLLDRPEGLRAMRDPTRGGLAGVLCELAEASAIEIGIRERAIPVSSEVAMCAELMGLDPLHLACEGRAVIVASPAAAAPALQALQGHPLGQGAALIGEVRQGPSRVVLRTAVGGERLVSQPAAEPLPRIC